MRRSTSSKPDDSETWCRRHSVREKHKSKTSSSEDKPKENKLPMSYPVRVAFAAAFCYGTHRLHSRSLRYDRKMAALTTKLARPLEPIIEPYKSEESDAVTAVSLWDSLSKLVTPTRYLRAWISGYYHCMASCGIIFCSAVNHRPTPTNKDDASLLLCRETEGHERVNKYFKAFNYPLKTYATDDVIAKAASEIES